MALLTESINQLKLMADDIRTYNGDTYIYGQYGVSKLIKWIDYSGTNKSYWKVYFFEKGENVADESCKTKQKQEAMHFALMWAVQGKI